MTGSTRRAGGTASDRDSRRHRWPARAAALAGAAAIVAWTAPAAAEGIVEVLHRSQAERLQALQSTAAAPSDDAVAIIRRSFDVVLAAQPGPVDATLRVVRGELLAETLLGRVVVVDASVAALPEPQRRFVLAHELAHVIAGHWGALGRLYESHVPGEVMRRQTDAVAALLGREASELAWRHEFEADAMALQVMQRLGHDDADVRALFMRLGSRPDTATHPGTRKRMAMLRAAAAN